MSQSYKMPLETATAEFTEKKSRFIAFISPVSSEDEAIRCMRVLSGF